MGKTEFKASFIWLQIVEVNNGNKRQGVLVCDVSLIFNSASELGMSKLFLDLFSSLLR